MDGKYFKLSFYLMDLNFSCPITFLLKENNNNNNNNKSAKVQFHSRNGEMCLESCQKAQLDLRSTEQGS